MSDEIRRMPRPEFDKPKRRVPFKLYAVISLPLGILWLLIEDNDVSWVTAFLAMLGIIHLSYGLARFILTEISISKELGILKKDRDAEQM